MIRRYLKPPPSQGLGGDPFIKPKVQTKLAMGKSDDKYEVEADNIADQVVNNTKNGDAVQKMEGEEDLQQKPIAADVTPMVQKMKSSEDEAPVQTKEEEEPIQAKEEEEPVQKMEEEEPVQAMEEEEEPVQKVEEEEAVQAMEEEEPVQAKSDGKNSKQPSIENRLKHSSGGTKMDAKIRIEMEKKFGTGFSHIKIHNDAAAAQMCQELGAQAFTHGNDIYFNQGKYNPNSVEGKRLLAHELTHTIQQGKVKNKNK